jgi:PPP family 3-phenylpropionic acid transporter
MLAERFGISVSFVIFIVLMFLCGLLATRLPAPQTKSSEPFLTNLRRLATNRIWLAFLIVLLLVGIGQSFIHTFSALYLTDLGAGEGLFGLTVLVAGIAELPIFFFSARLLKRFSASGLLVISFSALVIRLLIFSAIPSPEWALLPQLLHGLTFSAFWAAAVVYVSDLAPPGLGATAQSSLGLVFFSAAGAVGGLIGANIYDSLGPVMLYRFGAILVASGLVGFVLIETLMRRISTLAKARYR